ncbi:hypothetical protein QQX98_003527 [Neonectria punicea]|uniref:Uncharacterized protein n=1 Tax=Neonectria punicea TaxID=979145 RepID=A0ABR1HD42_9HYPO
MYCHKKQSHQSACCTTDVKSMKVHGTCEWGAYPDCDGQDGCPNPAGDSSKNYMWAGSASGSGGGEFCCDVHNANLRFTDCQWYKDVGPAPEPRPRNFCRSGCPPDRVRVAIDTEADVCNSAGMGSMVRCCKTRLNDGFEAENSKLDVHRSAIKEWIDDLTCPNPASSLSRRTDLLGDVVANTSSTPMEIELASRDGVKTQDITAQLLLTYILARVGSEEMLEEMGRIWDVCDFGNAEEEFGPATGLPSRPSIHPDRPNDTFDFNRGFVRLNLGIL